MNSELDEALIDPIYEELERVVNEGLDRKLVFTKVMEEFGKVRKLPVLPAVATHRVRQVENLVNRLKVSIKAKRGGGLENEVEFSLVVDPQDELVFNLLKFGSEWHESLDIEATVIACMPG
jgi:hypothetical protein